MTIRLFIAMLQTQQSSSGVNAATILTLNTMLKETDLLALHEEPDDCLEAFQNWLLKVVTDESQSSMDNEAMESLFLLAMSTGSLATFLAGIYVLCNKASSLDHRFVQHPFLKQMKASKSFSIKLLPHLRKLFSYQVDLILSPISQDYLSSMQIFTEICFFDFFIFRQLDCKLE